MKKFISLICSVLILTFACNKSDQPKDPPPPEAGSSIADLIAGDTSFSSLAQVIKSTNYSDELGDPHVQITFLAPNNKAFKGHLDTIPANSVEEWDSLIFARKYLTYWTVRGEYNLQSMTSGVYSQQYCALDEEWLCSEILVENANGMLIFNGGDHFGAKSTGRVIEADNGSIIEITALPNFQSALEMLNDADFLYSVEYFQSMVRNSSSYFQAKLKASNWGDLLVADEPVLLQVLDAYLKSILDAEDLDDLLSASQRDSLFQKYSVNSSQDLVGKITLDDLQSFAGITTQDIYAQLEEDDYTEWMEHLFITDGIIEYIIAENPQNRDIESEAGVTYNVSKDGQGNILLTDTSGNVIELSERMMNSSTGDLYLVSELY